MLLGALLLIDGLSSGLRIARLVSVLVIYPPIVGVLVAARALVASVLVAGGALLLQRRPAAWTIAQAALVASAALVVLETGLALVPTSLFPVYRWPAVALYGVYAVSAAWWLRARSRAGET